MRAFFADTQPLDSLPASPQATSDQAALELGRRIVEFECEEAFADAGRPSPAAPSPSVPAASREGSAMNAPLPASTPASKAPSVPATPVSVEDSVLALWADAVARSKSNEYFFGPAAPLNQFGRFLDLMARVGRGIDGKRCVDFGCGAGRPLSISALLYLVGAESVVATDVESMVSSAAAARGLLALLSVVALRQSGLENRPGFDKRRVASRLADFDFDALRAGDLVGGVPSAIRHVVGNYVGTESEIGPFDVVVSNSVFEHVPDLGGTLTLMRKNLRAGGVIYSDVDYRDHRVYVTGVSPWQYLVDDGDHAPGYINKIRHTAMRALYATCGFRVEESHQVTTEPPAAITQNLHPRYAATSAVDLAIVQDTLLLI